ncbi:FAD-dependent oxidoreductase [Rhodobacterales bacterium HKCCE3408]|nr:FAD-dependent oxidoreductase [Rhodobacterales bacterium HKCCE3408]
MPFEQSAATAPRRIAVIGGGISGMSAAYHLSHDHSVTLFEAENRLGGHARTVFAGKAGDQWVDTGFIVFNRVNYPGLVKLFEELSVPVAESDMSFAASIDGGKVEYGLQGLRSLFAQPQNVMRPQFLRMLRDLAVFNSSAFTLAKDDGITLGAFLDKLGMGRWFRDYYLTPISGAIWSTPKEEILDFPAQALVRFFRNHHLMSVTGQHQWYTVDGGSIQYVTRLQGAMEARGVALRTGTPIRAVLRRPPGGISVITDHGTELFDEIVFATHSDDTLRLLGDATRTERAALSAIRYQPNEAVLHADPRVMPKRRITWASWNYTEAKGHEGGPVSLSYWMNRLQPIPQDDPMFVTLNPRLPIDDRLIYDTTTFRHPVYDLAALAAQKRIAEMNGTHRTWFCGAWMKNGFHEDGYSSALDVVEAISARDRAMAVAAE